MSKRFTDASKWKNEWFRTLPDKAKLAWIYLCDECDYAGIIKLDFGLAGFQLSTQLDSDQIVKWFGDRIRFISDDLVLIVQFFEFQYGASKDTWSAKVRARERLEALGFTVTSKKIILDKNTHSGPTVTHGDGSVLSISIGRSISSIKKETREISKTDLEDVYKEYPRKDGKAPGMKIAVAQIKTKADLSDLRLAMTHYRASCKRKKIQPDFVLYFSTFMNQWRDWLDPKHGETEDFSKAKPDYSGIQFTGPEGVCK